MKINLKNVQSGDIMLVSKSLPFSHERSYNLYHVSNVLSGIISTYEGDKYQESNGFNLSEIDVNFYGTSDKYRSVVHKVWKKRVVKFTGQPVKVNVLCIDSKSKAISESTQVLTWVVGDKNQYGNPLTVIINGSLRFINSSCSTWYDEFVYTDGIYQYVILDKIVFKGV